MKKRTSSSAPAKRAATSQRKPRAPGRAVPRKSFLTPPPLSRTSALAVVKPDEHLKNAWEFAQGAHRVYQAIKPGLTNLRQQWSSVTSAVGTSKFPDPPKAKSTGPRDTELFPSLVPVEGTDYGSAPSAVSETISRYAEIAGNDRAMRIKTRYPLLHFGVDANAGASGTIVPQGGMVCYRATSAIAGVGAVPLGVSVVGLNPLRMPFMYQNASSPAKLFDYGMAYPDALSVSDIALGFSMYRVCGPITFYYEPQSGSSAQPRLDFAFTEDAGHPVLGLTNVNPTCPTVTQIDATTNSVGFAPWNSWQMTVNPDTSWKYTYITPAFGSGQSSVTGMTLANSRMSSFGAISCVVSNSVVAGSIYGRLLMEVEYEFKDPVPLAGLSPFLSMTRIDQTLIATYGHPKGSAPGPDDSTFESKRPMSELLSVAEPPPPAPAPPPPPSSSSSSSTPSLQASVLVRSPTAATLTSAFRR